MPVIRDCLTAAKKGYKDILQESEIQSVFEALQKHREKALESGDDLYASLNQFAENNIRDRERANIADELQQLKAMQAVVDNLQRIELFNEKGFKDPILKALKAKIAGSPYKISRGRDNTETKMVRARTTFERQFLQDINNDLGPLWLSKDYQTEIADSILAINRGEKPPEGPFGKLGEIVKKYQEKLNMGRKALGIDINELEDRIAPNIHSQGKILKLTRADRKIIKIRGQTNYDFLFDRWRDFIYPLLDKARTFGSRDIDINDRAAVDDFLRNAFDNITNKGKVTQDKVNFANKVKQPRVLHWEDGKSLVAYNDEFGTGALQDSITRELSFGFGQLEMMKDWGVNPVTTLERTLKVLDENPEYKERFGKGEELKNLGRLLRSLSRNDADYAGTIGDIGRNIRAWESMTKLGQVVLSSIPDLALIANEAANLHLPAYQAIPGALRNIVLGMNRAEKAALVDLLESSRQNQMGSVAKFYETDFSPSSLAGKGVRLMHKLNGLERWDYGNRSYIVSSISRFLAQNRHFSWDMLQESDKGIFDLYNITKHDWDTIRQVKTKSANGKLYITPEGIQDIPEDAIRAVLKEQGVNKITPTRIQDYRDSVENKFRDYFQDRQDHAILRPDVIDHDILSFGQETSNNTLRAILKMFSQFKMYSLAYIRKPLFAKLYGKGARDFNEALIGGKADYMGIAKLTSYMMALSYASSTLKNLVQGLSPPSLTSAKTWKDMLGESLGLYGMVLRLDPNDWLGSTAKTLAGPGLTDVSKLIKAGYQSIGSLVTGDWDATNRAWFGFIKNNLPLIKQAYTIKILNDLMFNEWQDTASPGKREKYLQELERDQGVSQIF